MELTPTNPEGRRAAAFTVAELLVAVTVGLTLLLAAIQFYCFSLRSFVAMANYTTLNNQSRNASDVLAREIRSAVFVVSATTNQLVLYAPDGTNVSYTYDAAGRSLTRTKGGMDQTLMKDLDSFIFSLYQRPASNSSYNQFPAATANNAKLVSFQWSCSRRVVGTEADSESIQTALVSLRNQ